MTSSDPNAAPLPDGVVEVSETGAGKFQQRVISGRHQLIADEPETFGGMDSGPGPYELLLAALGTCTAMTIRLYAERKAMALAHVSVSLRHQRVHEEDAEDETRGHLERITREIHLEGDLSADNRRRLMEIADHCPVHRTLTGRLEIRTRERTA
jgi:putative redox protein